MIEEVNGASATLSKTSKADEPVSFSIGRYQNGTDDYPAFPNRAHPQRTSFSAPGYRPGNIGSAGQGSRSAEGRANALIAIRQRAAKLGFGWQQ